MPSNSKTCIKDDLAIVIERLEFLAAYIDIIDKPERHLMKNAKLLQEIIDEQ